ncbi:non-ribosomal peptide synthetase [Lysobacter enzymogenes]|uniref:non-ribosomal peptide synthetase n=1 Tax=Lysobacter enzymogenes TaxID=69 RepID=UPI00099B9A0B|nr:non-ribosomal peptide synthetase [Lysobacter enzymogenes]UZW58371.1 non-ribosomal peptide synthetase [Lysobacter enzymogenes]
MPSEHRLIGLMADPGLQLLTGMLGILRSGHAFVPLDAKHPVERLAAIARDCGLEMLVTQSRWLALARQVAASCPSLKHVICLDRIEDDRETAGGEGGARIHDARDYLDAPLAARPDAAAPADPQSLVYVIYTSGSTGVPKGVPISNENLIPILLWSRDYFGLGEHTRVLQNLSYCFDFGVYELLTTLLFGGTLYFTDRHEVSGVGFYRDFIARNRIDTVHTTPSYFRDVLALDGGLDSLAIVHLGGEALHRSAVEQIYRAVGEECAVYNGYGPTEASVNSTIFGLKSGRDLQAVPGQAVPIGRATADNRTYLLDARMQPVAAGVPGELYIGGPGVARGYLARPALTAERFLPDPFADEPGARAYRTGDRVRFVGDGEIEFLGRLDEQVKLRGFRIELGELEATLLAHPDVTDAAAVVASAESGKRLVAFVVLRPQAPPHADAPLRAYLRERLPEYMVPARILPQPRLPLNPNGKTDRRRLAELAAEAAPATDAVAAAAPRSAAGELVAAAWEQVLGVRGIGPDDNFFELGGHSLLATQVINRLRDAFGSDLPLYLLFEQPTLGEFTRHLERLGRDGADARAPAIGPAPRGVDLPLSFPQERLWFLNRLEPDDVSYLITRAIRIDGPLDHAVLEQVFSELVRRHEILRTTFPAVDGLPVQRIHAPFAMHIPVIDLSATPACERQAEVERLILREGRRPFDLDRLPLLRVNVARLGEGEHVVILNEHHLVHDGWAQGVLIREFLALYLAFSTGQPSPLPPPRLQFADFAYWQRDWMRSGQLQRQLEYWRGQLDGADSGLNLATDRPRRGAANSRGAQLEFSISAQLSAQLRAFSRREGATLFMTMLAGFKALLHHYTGQEDISLGSGIANRRSQELEDLLGMMVNTVVMRTDLSGDPSFRTLIERVRKVCLGAYSHQDAPFDKVVEALRPERNRGHSPLFQGMFAFMDAPTRELTLPGLSLSVVETHNRSAKFDFTVIVLPLAEQLVGQSGREVPSEIEVQFEYNADLFDESTILRMWRRYLGILEAVVADPELRLAQLPLLGDEERERVLHGYNPAPAPWPDPQACAHHWFEARARLAPAAEAVSDRHQRLSYAELNQRANRLAHHLIGLGVQAETKIAICLPRSVESLVAALACFKAGAAYVALDPDYPRQRLEFMLEDSQARIVLTLAALAERFASAQVDAISLDADWPRIAGESAHDPGLAVDPRQLAYVIYTSGSTGTPKGVAVEHRGLANLIAWHRDAYVVTAQDRATMLAGPGFDASVWEVWPYLAAGASVHVPGEDERNTPERLLLWLAAQRATICFLPTPLAMAALNEAWPEPMALRAVLTGGDKLLRRPPPELAATLFNHYGPTEYSVVATGCEVAAQDDAPAPPIGRPIANTRVYLLDARLEPVAQGLPGELCIGGAGLARGYLSRPALTAERFVPDPFGAEPGARLYRSGDLARWREDGELEFLGRADRQVKLRGFRIELEEIEAAAIAHPAVAEAAVVVREDGGGARLVAYFVARPGQKVSPAQLREHLGQRLPVYMVPAAAVALDALPLSPNGKLDRRALPAPAAGNGAGETGPRDPVEEIVAGIWGAVLGVERIGPHDDFFAIGGHSLLATRVAMRINESFGVELALRELFEAPTPAELAARIRRLGGAGAERGAHAIARLPRGRPLPLSFAQQRLWFLDQLEPGKVNYNIPVAVRLSGRLDADALERSIAEIVNRHETLRTTFASAGGQPQQTVAAPGEWRLQRRDLDGLAPPQREAEASRQARREAARPFDLARDALLRGTLWRLDEEEHVLLLVTHHIVFDGWSAGVLVQELTRLYLAFRRGEASPLAPLPVQYADFAQWQRDRLGAERLEPQLRYWRRRLSGPLPVLELPVANRRDAAAPARAATQPIAFAESLHTALRRFNRERGVTSFMTLLAAFQCLLHRYTGLDDILIGTPVSGRSHIDVEPLIGFFANTLVLRGDVSDDPSFAALLARARESTLEGHAHGEIPFEMLVQELQPERHLDHTPLFQVMLVVQGEAGEAQLPELSVRPLPMAASQVKFDLTLVVAESGQGLSGHWEYDPARIDGATVARMGAHLATLLECAMASPDTPVSRLPMLSPQELRQATAQSNGTAAAWPEVCLHELVQAQAARTPDAIALIDGARRISYRELNRSANRLARRLRARGVGPDSVVGVVLHRSAQMVVALLGVLKAGGAYLPLDPEYPPERLAMMVEDARPGVLLSQDGLRGLSERLGGYVVYADAEDRDDAPHADADFDSGAGIGNLAYLLYTSGSTGRPKGVAVEHRSASAFVHWACARFSAEQLAGVLASTSICFDLSVFELFVPLASGGCVVLARDALELATLEAADAVTLINTVPSALSELLRLGAIGERVCAINLAGEPLLNALAQRAYAQPGVRQVMNLYGPSEDTTYSTCVVVERGATWAPTIGRPISNTQAYILDRAMQPAPPGVTGELFLGGAGLARGYLRRPGLTAERFVPDALSGIAGARLYRTGDLARLREDGEIEFLGRADRQIKLRGFRIELAEIEAALAAHPQVRDAAAIVRENAAGEASIVACFVARQGSAATAADLRARLKQQLPHYMVPSAFLAIEALPLSPNGKIDRAALATLAAADTAPPADAVAPRNPLEQAVADIWAAVLGVERVGVHDDFFDLGGHSLVATQVASRISESFQIELPLRAVFEAPTVEELARRIQALVGSGARQRAQPIPRQPRGAPLSLSFAQQRLWFLSQFEGADQAYRIAGGVRLTGALDRAALRRALDEIANRHDALRTTFAQTDGRPVQVVADPGAGFAFEHSDLRSAADPAAALRELALHEAAAPFDLQRGPLARARLAQLGDNDHALLLTMHHIVSDGWSMGVLVNELGALYRSFRDAQPPALPELPIQYADYAAWQRQWLSSEVLAQQAQYWRDTLAGAPALLELPTDRPRPAEQDYAGDALEVSLDPELASRLRTLARRHGTTLYAVLLAGWAALLARLSGQDDVVVGAPVANRTRTEIEPLIGFCANTVALRLDLGGAPNVAELLRRVAAATLEAQQHQDIPFEQVVELAQPTRSLAHAPLFQVMFAWQNAPAGRADLPELGIAPIATPRVASIFDLTLSLRDSGAGIVGALEYATSLFDRSTVERYLGYWRTLLQALSEDDAAPARRLPLLSGPQLQQVLQRWSRSDDAVTAPAMFAHEAFERQAARTPGAAALRYKDRSLSYAELEDEANRLARHLRALGVGPDAGVAICMERSPQTVVALLATLKAGGACIPLDAAYPAERVAYVLRDSAPAVALTHAQTPALWRELLARAPDAATVVDLDADRSRWADRSGAPFGRDETGLQAQHLAYVLYTSGSTGQPKGVAMPHAALANLIGWQNAGAEAGAAPARCLQFAALGFDVAFQEIFATLAAGAELEIVDEGLRRDFAQLLQHLRARRIERLYLPYAALQALAEAASNLPDAAAPALKEVVTAGEQLHITPQIAAWFARMPRCRLFNHYGPTETHVATTHELTGAPAQWPGLPPIGRPVVHSAAYVLDRDGQPVPAGVVGEVHLAGRQLARGYHRQPAQTAARFVPDPFGGEPGLRLYCTGDLGRWRHDGELEYLGRADRQVKLRGFRIELEEIESALLAHADVADAAVVLDQAQANGGDTRLVAFVVARQGAGLDDASDAALAQDGDAAGNALRPSLRGRLPDYMVPAAIVPLAALPLTPNGKIDRTALARLAAQAGRARAGAAAPMTAMQTRVAAAWEEVLDIAGIGPDDNFFDLGGHSLSASRMSSRLRDSLRVAVPVKRVFLSPTVAELAAWLESQRADAAHAPAAIARAPRDEDLPLSFAQQRLWLDHRLAPASAAYNMPAAMRIQGRLDIAAFERTIGALYERHEALRTTFELKHDRPVQIVGEAPRQAIRVEDLSRLPAQARERRAQELAAQEASAPFDLAAGPAFRVRLLRLGDREHVALMTAHHIVCDGWSVELMKQEIGRLYQAYAGGVEPQLPVLPVQYADYARWQREQLRDERMRALLDYWRRTLSGAAAPRELATDRPRPATPGLRGEYRHFALPDDLARGLRELSRQQGATLYMTLLAVFDVLLARHTGSDDVVVGSAVAGRGPLEVEGLIGCFVNMLVLRSDLSGDPRFRDLLARVKEASLGAFAHQDLPFDVLVDELKPQRRPGRPPFFQVAFGLQNQHKLAMDTAGLTLSAYPVKYEAVRYDLTVWVYENADALEVKWTYRSDLFDAQTIERLQAQYVSLLRSAVERPDARISSLSARARPGSAAAAAEQGAEGAGVLALSGRRRKPVALPAEHVEEANMSQAQPPPSAGDPVFKRGRSVRISQQTLVKTGFHEACGPCPLVVQPVVDGLNLAAWADANVGFIDERLATHGAILFRGFRLPEVSEFERFVKVTSGEPLTYSERSSPRSQVRGAIYTSTDHPPEYPIFLHNEQSYNVTFPARIFFHCLVASQTGGQTPIADTRRVLGRISAQTRDRFERSGYMYVRNFGDGLGLSWQNAFQTASPTAVEAYCRANDIGYEWKGDGRLKTWQVRRVTARHAQTGETVWFNHATFFHVSTLDAQLQERLRDEFGEDALPNQTYYGDGTPIPAEVMQELREAYLAEKTSFPWQPGDVLMLDNMLCAHGREPYTGARKVVVGMARASEWSDV